MPRNTYHPCIAVFMGKRVRALREARGLSQRDVCIELSISPATIHRWETGEHGMSLESVCLLARMLKISPGDLLPSLDELEGLLL